MIVSEQTVRNRRTAGQKAAAAKKAKALRVALAGGPPMDVGGQRGTERGDYSPAEILARIRAREEAAR